MNSIIIPTYNESKNLPKLFASLTKALSEARMDDYEILIMDDDSPDGTAELANRAADRRVRGINRRGRPRGLSYAVIDGFKEAKGENLLVMDADLSHPPDAVPRLIRAITEDGLNLAIGSRYVAGGGIRNWPAKRVWASRVACWLGQMVTPVKDATSGFFCVRRSVIDVGALNPLGFKIGLEVFVKARHAGRYREVPYVFEDRAAGESKLSSGVILAYFKQVALLLLRH